MKLFYFPVGFTATACFFFANLAMLPFAYSYALLHKFIILVRVPSCSAFAQLFIYITFGSLFHSISLFIDTVRFLLNSYDDKLTRVVKLKYGTEISKQAFDSVRLEIENTINSGLTTQKAEDIVVNIREKMGVTGLIFQALYGYKKKSADDTAEEYAVNFSAKAQNGDRENALLKIKVYGVIKEMIWQTVKNSTLNAPTDQQYVDLFMLGNLLNEIQTNIDVHLH